MHDLTLTDSAARLGEGFAVESGAGPSVLTLREAREIPQSPRPAGGFRLEFEGPLQPVLPQSIYVFTVGGDRRDIFIVPIGPKEGGMRYGAVFF